MGNVLIRNITDSFVNQARPTKNYSTLARLKANATGNGDAKYIYMFFGKPYPLGASIQSGFLDLYNAVATTGSVTVTVERLTQKWSGSRVNWNNKPSVGGTAYSVTRAASPAGSVWSIDIKPLIQLISNGGAWYGIRITVNGTSVKTFHSAQSNDTDKRPAVRITWGDAPDMPEDLNPRGNRAVSVAKPVLTTDFVDVSGDTTFDALQVQIDAAGDFSSGIDWDSGWVPNEVPQLDLATQGATLYPGLANNASTWWRARVRDGSGLESSWSDPVQFKRVDFGTVTINNPAPSSPTISDVTPPISWTVTGMTQTAYQILIVDPLSPNDVFWNSGKITSTDTTVTVPNKKIPNITDTYRLILRVWDDVSRQGEGDRKPYLEQTLDFTFQKSNTVGKVTALAAAPQYPYPWVTLTWDRSSMPDSYTIIMDGEVFDSEILPEEVFVSGTSYSYTARRVPARVSHTFEVISVVNGVSSGSNPTVNITTRPSVTWLMNTDASEPICIVKSGSEPSPVVDAQNGLFQEVHQPIGGGAPVLITQYQRGFEGHVEGVLSDDIVGGLSARTMRNRFKKFKKKSGTPMLLFMVDETLEVVCYNMTYRPRAKSGGKILYDISFDFFEAE